MNEAQTAIKAAERSLLITELPDKELKINITISRLLLNALIKDGKYTNPFPRLPKRPNSGNSLFRHGMNGKKKSKDLFQ